MCDSCIHRYLYYYTTYVTELFWLTGIYNNKGRRGADALMHIIYIIFFINIYYYIPAEPTRV